MPNPLSTTQATLQSQQFHKRFAHICTNESGFDEAFAIQLFHFQAETNAVYKAYLQALRRDAGKIERLEDIPHLPISFFKSHAVKSHDFEASLVFSSSGTTGMEKSRHFVHHSQLYEQVCVQLFERAYGETSNWVILALLPAYLEREGSSLIHMVDLLIRRSGHSESGFFLHNHEALCQKYQQAKHAGKKVLLLGVSFALLDLAEKRMLKLAAEDVVMETGGMKGRRKELIREELHSLLCSGLGVTRIHSEYGMTELLSQAYSQGQGLYKEAPWMKVLVRDTNDPFRYLEAGRTGGLNIIDLANIDSCAFIQTQDLGRKSNENTFEVLGRFDHSDVRGCNLLAL
ncbi:MAG: acyl transferase [Sphingobacteriaceae bacterium]|nr:acyl transferase [Sphingobacteriaceae bacterium]